MEGAAEEVMGRAGTVEAGAEAVMEAEAAEVAVGRAMEVETIGALEAEAAVMVETGKMAQWRSPFPQAFEYRRASPRCP